MTTHLHKAYLVPCACTGDAECHGCPTPNMGVEALREKRHYVGTLFRCPVIKGKMGEKGFEEDGRGGVSHHEVKVTCVHFSATIKLAEVRVNEA